MIKRTLYGLIFCLLTVPALAQDTTYLTLLFAGDIMQHDSQIKAAFDPLAGNYDYTTCFQYIKPLLRQADLAVANLELTLAGPPYTGYPQFSAPDNLATALQQAGFDVLMTANNHSLDHRKKGLERTIDVLNELQMLHTGTFKDSVDRAIHYPLKVVVNGFVISFLNYTYGTNGIPVSPPNIVNLIDTVQIKKDLNAAKAQNPDIIIAFVHWGLEYQQMPAKSQKDLAAYYFRHGASLVIGAHPHVLQPMEWGMDKNHLIAYSLGNFISGQQSRYRDGGAVLWVELQKITSDTTVVTQITGAAYELVWVYRDEGNPKKYFLLPVKEFESDSIRIANTKARDNFRTFIDDSRMHLKNNVRVEEGRRPLLENHYYKILLTTLPGSAEELPTSPLLQFYGLEKEARDGKHDWVVGKFYDKALAFEAWKDIVTNTPYTGAKIVRYYWGEKQEILSPGKDNAK